MNTKTLTLIATLSLFTASDVTANQNKTTFLENLSVLQPLCDRMTTGTDCHYECSLLSQYTLENTARRHVHGSPEQQRILLYGYTASLQKLNTYLSENETTLLKEQTLELENKILTLVDKITAHEISQHENEINRLKEIKEQCAKQNL
jgi:hypothetical protein